MTSPSIGGPSSHILVSCKQTRFHIEAPVYQELDIQNLNITITSTNDQQTASKSKGKSRNDGLEILSGATLKLKPGVHYALVGRNGTGKSTVLRAISEKLIPGIPLATKIASLEQTDNFAEKEDGPSTENQQKSVSKERSVLEEVIERAFSRDDMQREIDILSSAIDNKTDTYAALRAVRNVRHERLKKEFFEVEKNARLRSGARGWDARKVLIAFEKKMEESTNQVSQPDDEISPSELSEETEAAFNMLTDLQAEVEPTRIANIQSTARKILTGLGFQKDNLEKPVNALSGGWQMRFSLASTLLQDSDILILDEPTNFLDLLGILWLQNYLIDLQSTSETTVLLVSHDRDFVDTVCEEIIILRDQTLTYFRGNISAYEEDTRSKKLYLGRMKEAQERQKTHMEKTIRENIKAGKATGDDNKLRQAKSRQKKLDDRMGLQVSAKGGRFKLNRDRAFTYGLTSRSEIEVPVDEKGVALFIPDAPDLRFPGPLVSLENVSFKYPAVSSKKPSTITKAAAPVLQNINLVLHKTSRIGIVGLNGSGKSTLIRLLLSENDEKHKLNPTSGTVTHHPRLRLGYYSQHSIEALQALAAAEPGLTALSLLSRDISSISPSLTTSMTSAVDQQEATTEQPALRSLLGSLGLPGRTASHVPLGKLSGGQLVRVALARILCRNQVTPSAPHLLVLDEITTHLDYATVRALCSALARWNGALVVVSHDRFFVRGVVEGDLSSLLDGSEDDEEEGDDGDGEEMSRKKGTVYLLKGGKMSVLDDGVSGFERSLLKRIERMEEKG